MTDPNRLSFKQFAEFIGVSPGRVSQAVAEGKLTVHTDPVSGLRFLDGGEAQREWRENTDPAKAIGSQVRDARRRAAEAAGDDDDPEDFTVPTLMKSRERLEHFKALTAEALYREKVGTLVEAEAVKREAFEAGRALRESILSVPDRLASELAAETDPNRVHARITDELMIALNAAADREPTHEQLDLEDDAEGDDAEGDDDAEEPA